MKRLWLFGALAIVFMAPVALTTVGGACGGGAAEEEEVDDGVEGATATLLGPDGSEVTSLDVASPVAAKFIGLTANTQYTVKTLDPSGNTVCEAHVYSDNSGTIPSSSYCYIRDNDASRFAENAQVDAMVVSDKASGFFAYAKDATPGDYRLVASDSSGNEVASAPVPVTSDIAHACASNSLGKCARSFLKNESNVYITIEEGSGVTTGTVVDIYVIAHRGNIGYTSGDTLQDVSPDGANTDVTVNYVGGLFTTATPVWANPANTGTYDVVIDVDRSGTYTTGDLVEILDQTPTDTANTNGLSNVGFTVQNSFTQDSDYVAQMAMDAYRGYQDIFSKGRNEDIYAELQPERRTWYERWVYKYVVDHKDAWTDGDTLVDVIPETRDEVQWGCTNEGLRLIAPINLLSPGCYDVVFDANANGKYDKGIDVVDNIDLNGANTCGFIVADDGITVTIDSIKTLEEVEVMDGTSTSTSQLVNITGTATSFSDNAVVKAYATHGTSTSGAMTGTISGGQFTVTNVPLSSGVNRVVVEVFEGTTYGSALASVTWAPAGSSGDNDFMAVITWLESTDMDTHFIKTGGTYTGRSPGDDNLADCTWDNCTRVANEAINWTSANGTSTTPDDVSTGAIARMDLDCINCEEKKETVWIQDTSAVEPREGNFLLCVVAFRGNDRPSAAVTVNGVQRASLTAPSNIDSGTGDDMWFVGYLSQNAVGALTWHTVNEVGVGEDICKQP